MWTAPWPRPFTLSMTRLLPRESPMLAKLTMVGPTKVTLVRSRQLRPGGQARGRQGPLTGELVQEARENTEEQEPGEPLEEETLLLSGPEAEEEPREGAVEEEVRGKNQDTWHQALMKTTRMMSPLMWVTELQGVTRTTLRGAGTSLC